MFGSGGFRRTRELGLVDGPPAVEAPIHFWSGDRADQALCESDPEADLLGTSGIVVPAVLERLSGLHLECVGQEVQFLVELASEPLGHHRIGCGPGLFDGLRMHGDGTGHVFQHGATGSRRIRCGSHGIQDRVRVAVAAVAKCEPGGPPWSVAHRILNCSLLASKRLAGRPRTRMSRRFAP